MLHRNAAAVNNAKSCEELILEVGKLLAHLVFSEISPKSDQLIINSPQMMTALADMTPQQRQIVKSIIKDLSTQNKSISRSSFTQILLINGNTIKKFNITHDLLLFDGCFYEIIQAASKYVASSQSSGYPQSIIDQLNQLKTKYQKSKRLSDIISIPAHSILKNKGNNTKQQQYQHIHHVHVNGITNNNNNTSNSPILLADLHAFIHRNKQAYVQGNNNNNSNSNTISNSNLKGGQSQNPYQNSNLIHSLLGSTNDLQINEQQHNKDSNTNLIADKLGLSPQSSSSSPRQANRVPLLHLTRDKQPSIESAMVLFQQEQQKKQQEQLQSLSEEEEPEPILELTRGYSNYLKYTKSLAKIATQNDAKDNKQQKQLSQQSSSPGKSFSPEYRRHQQTDMMLFDGFGYLELKRSAQNNKLHQQPYHHYLQPQHPDSTSNKNNYFNNPPHRSEKHNINNSLHNNSSQEKIPTKIGRSLLEMKPTDTKYYQPHNHNHNSKAYSPSVNGSPLVEQYSPTIKQFVKAYEDRIARMVSNNNNNNDENNSSYDYYMNAFGDDSDLLNNLSASSDSQQQYQVASKFLSRPRQEQPIMQLNKSFLAGNLSDKSKEYLLKLEETALNNDISIRSSQLAESRTSQKKFTLRPYLKSSQRSGLKSKNHSPSRQNIQSKDEGSSNGENTIRSSGSKSQILSLLKSNRSSHSTPRSQADSQKNTPPDSSRRNSPSPDSSRKNQPVNHAAIPASNSNHRQHSNNNSTTIPSTHHGIPPSSSSPPPGHVSSQSSNQQINTSTPSHSHGILNSRSRENTLMSNHSISSYAIQVLKPINAMKQSGKIDHNVTQDKEPVKGTTINNNNNNMNTISSNSSFYDKKKISRNKNNNDEKMSPEKSTNTFKSNLSAFMQRPAVELLPDKVPSVEEKIIRPIFERTSKSYRDFLQGFEQPNE